MGINRHRRSRFLFVFGTRPEAIKLAPLIFRARDIADVSVCVTGQHRSMLDQVLGFFSISPDYDLGIMTENQSLINIAATSLTALEGTIEQSRPDLIVVQGDTTTAFVGALSGFYKGIRVAHVEAGLRTFNKLSPFPEEINRVLVGRLADYHFAPTRRARENLLRENVPEEAVHVVGNTVVDALLMGLAIVGEREAEFYDNFDFIDFSKKVILVTGHRRESFGKPFEDVCRALERISREDVEIVYPVHLNPNVRSHVYRALDGIRNVHLIEPLDYPRLIWLMSKSRIILTDSGGIQEEAPSLNKPVLVMREVTERVEGVEAGTAVLVGTDTDRIVETTLKLLTDRAAYEAMAARDNPYGDGKASERIRDLLAGVTGKGTSQ